MVDSVEEVSGGDEDDGSACDEVDEVVCGDESSFVVTCATSVTAGELGATSCEVDVTFEVVFVVTATLT